MTRRRKSLSAHVKKFVGRILHEPHPVLRLLYIALGVGALVGGVMILWVAITPTPDLTAFLNRRVALSTKIYDRTGTVVLYDLNTDVKRTEVPLAEISPNIQKAAISIEDSGFYEHGGVSFTGIARSIYVDIRSGSLAQGGSTITQQVVKLTILTNQRSFIRKIHEWILALKLEQKYSKDQILEMYLNDVPYGGSLYGAEAASRAFFGKSAKDVTLGEAAYLASIPNAPTFYSPYGNNRAALDTRKNLVLTRMQVLGYITDAQMKEARAEKVVFNPPQNSSIIAPHFDFYIRQYLEDKYGPDAVTQGLSIVTTIDADLQHQAEAIVNDYAQNRLKQFKASNASLVAIDPKTGQILAMVGSRNYFDTEIDGNYNAALALRQPGSSFKPFVYAAALAKGYTPQTAIFDLPTQFSTACAPDDNHNDAPPCYAPQNFDNNFRGPMTFTTALAQSINIPAVKILYLAGAQNVIDLAHKAGLTTIDQNPNHYGLTLALGAAEVRLLDLTDAYGTFANDGVYHPATGIIKVTDSTGKVLEEFKDQPTQAIDVGVARDISSMLSNNDARQPEYAPVNPLSFPGFDVAAKTGTTNDYRDVWTVGYTPSIVVGTWAGNNNNSPMVKEIAGYVVAPMWNQFMQVALAKYPKEYFGEPRAIPDNAPPVLRGQYSDTTGAHDILYWVNKSDPLSGGSSRGDGQYPYWDYPVSIWSASQGVVAPPPTTPTQDTATSTTVTQ